MLTDPGDMSEDPQAKQSWVSEGDLMKMLETFAEFPIWVTDIFKCGAPMVHF
jgi:salicylate hydroxylase